MNWLRNKRIIFFTEKDAGNVSKTILALLH